MNPPLLVAGAAFIFAALFLVGFILPPVDPIALLRDRFIRLSRLDRSTAERELADRVEGLTRRHPGRSYSWYVRWLIRDLERAKKIR